MGDDFASTLISGQGEPLQQCTVNIDVKCEVNFAREETVPIVIMEASSSSINVNKQEGSFAIDMADEEDNATTQEELIQGNSSNENQNQFESLTQTDRLFLSVVIPMYLFCEVVAIYFYVILWNTYFSNA